MGPRQHHQRPGLLQRQRAAERVRGPGRAGQGGSGLHRGDLPAERAIHAGDSGRDLLSRMGGAHRTAVAREHLVLPGAGVRDQPRGRHRDDPERVTGAHQGHAAGRADRVRLPRHRARWSARTATVRCRCVGADSGMFQSFAQLHADPSRVNYLEGQTLDIMWNVAESGCGAAPCGRNRPPHRSTPTPRTSRTPRRWPPTRAPATPARLRQPQLLLPVPASTSAPPAAASRSRASTGRTAQRTAVTIPSNQYVAAALAGQDHHRARPPRWPRAWPPGSPRWVCPTSGAAAGPVRARTTGAPGAAATTTVAATIGFDCSGLTAYVIVMAATPVRGRTRGTTVRRPVRVVDEGQPGDIVGFPGHVAIYLGQVGGQPYILEASRRRDSDPHRAAQTERQGQHAAPALGRRELGLT